MDDRYELVFGYMHCVGRTQYHCGYVDTQDAADQWSRTRAREDAVTLDVPQSDPLRWCPVHHCHMKRQPPWFGYRSMDGKIVIRGKAGS